MNTDEGKRMGLSHPGFHGGDDFHVVRFIEWSPTISDDVEVAYHSGAGNRR
jgi:hypothetical protein